MRINTNSWTNQSYFNNPIISSSSEMVRPAYNADNIEQKYPSNQTFSGMLRNLSNIENRVCDLRLDQTPMQCDLKITDKLNEFAKRAEQFNKTLCDITKSKDGNIDRMNLFACLEYDVCIFVQELLNLLNTKQWEQKQQNIFYCDFIANKSHSSIDNLNYIVEFIRRFNQEWSGWFIFTSQEQSHFRESYLLKASKKYCYSSSEEKVKKNYTDNYSLFQHINTWHFKIEYSSQNIAHLIWEKESMPILVADTTLKGLVPILDNLSHSGTTRFHQIALKKVENISQDIDDIKNILINFDASTPKALYGVLASIKSISMELASENISFSKKELLSLSLIDKILAGLPQLINIQEDDTHFSKFEKIYIFLMWHMLIKEHLFGHRIINNQDKNSGLFMMECLFFLGKTLSRMDIVLLKTVIKINDKLDTTLNQKGVEYQEFLISFLKQKYIFESRDNNVDNNNQKEHYSKFITTMLEIQSEAAHKENTVAISFEKALYIRTSRYMTEYWTHQLENIKSQNTIYTDTAQEHSFCSANILSPTLHFATNSTAEEHQESNDSWAFSVVSNAMMVDDEQNSEPSAFSLP